MALCGIRALQTASALELVKTGVIQLELDLCSSDFRSVEVSAEHIVVKPVTNPEMRFFPALPLTDNESSLLGTYEGYLGGVEHPITRLGAKLASEIDHTTPSYTLSGAAEIHVRF